jgi:hypothetical protein
MKLQYHPEARREIIEAAMYYENERPGLGAEFLDEIDDGANHRRQTPFAPSKSWHAAKIDECCS